MYNLSDINHVFDESRFKSFDKQGERWILVENNHTEYFKNVSSLVFSRLYTKLKVQRNKVPEVGENTYIGYISMCSRLG